MVKGSSGGLEERLHGEESCFPASPYWLPVPLLYKPLSCRLTSLSGDAVAGMLVLGLVALRPVFLAMALASTMPALLTSLIGISRRSVDVVAAVSTRRRSYSCRVPTDQRWSVSPFPVSHRHLFCDERYRLSRTVYGRTTTIYRAVTHAISSLDG